MNSFLGHAHGIKDEVVERLDTIAHKLEGVHAATDALQKREEMIRVSMNAAGVPVAGVLVVQLQGERTPNSGFMWEIQRLATVVASTTDGTNPVNVGCQVYLDSMDPSNLVEVITGASLFADAVSNNIYLAENRTLIARFNGLPAVNVSCTVAMQVKQMKVPGRQVHGQYSVGDW